MNKTRHDLKVQARDYLNETEDYVRANPSKALMIGVGVGYGLSLFPIRFLMFGLIRAALFLVRPALFVYGLSTLFDALKRRSGMSGSRPRQENREFQTSTPRATHTREVTPGGKYEPVREQV